MKIKQLYRKKKACSAFCPCRRVTLLSLIRLKSTKVHVFFVFNKLFFFSIKINQDYYYRCFRVKQVVTTEFQFSLKASREDVVDITPVLAVL